MRACKTAIDVKMRCRDCRAVEWFIHNGHHITVYKDVDRLQYVASAAAAAAGAALRSQLGAAQLFIGSAPLRSYRAAYRLTAGHSLM